MVNFGCEKKICFAFMCFTLMIFETKGQQYNLTGSSKFAVLGEEFTWTCSMFIPPEQTINAVKFHRDHYACAAIGQMRGNCTVQDANDRYRYECSSDFMYTLTIPAQNMTEYEKGSAWSCEYVVNSMYRSPVVILSIASSPIVKPFPQRYIVEGKDLTVTCLAEPGNPNSTIFFWIKEANPMFIQNGATLQLQSIHRSHSGIYRCTAENLYGNGEKGIHSQSMVLNVLYPPTVMPFLHQNIIEGVNFTVTCLAIPGNPNDTTFFWTMEDDSLFRENGTTLHLPNLKRTSSGIYRCTAENFYGNGEKGTHSQSMILNVLYQPSIEKIPLEIVNESSTVFLQREISSNPLSNVSWYRGTEIFRMQTYVSTATFHIQQAKCTDTQNFTILASNGIKDNVSVVFELIVNCKPKLDFKNITLGVTDTTGIEFSVTVTAYPEPQYELKFENRTVNNKMQDSICRLTVNKFTIHFEQNEVKQSDYGTYHLHVGNRFGIETVSINVLPQKTPDAPRMVKIFCEETSASVQWISSFNGGDTQEFAVVVSNGHFETSYSDFIPDSGESEIHSKIIQNLQPSSEYLFSVSARNKHGESTSEKFKCTTKQKDTGSHQIAVIAGCVGGTLTVIVIVLITVFLVHRRYSSICMLQKRNENKANTMKEDTSYYTTIAEQENRERNVYESLRRQNISEERDINKSQKRELKTKDPTTQESKNSTVKPAEVYVNTSFM